MRMTAAVMYEQGLPRPFAQSRPFVIQEVELDGPGPGEVLVEIQGAGLCHSGVDKISFTGCRALRRWYGWLMQQAVLVLLLSGTSMHECTRQTGRSRSTVRRWSRWLQRPHLLFSSAMRSREPELGRHDGLTVFWRQVIDRASLMGAMTCRGLIAPPHKRRSTTMSSISPVHPGTIPIDPVALFLLSVLGPLALG